MDPMADEDPLILQNPPAGTVAYCYFMTAYFCCILGFIISAVLAVGQPMISHLFGLLNVYTASVSSLSYFAVKFLLFYAYYTGRFCAPSVVGRPLKLAMDLIALLLALSIALLHSWNIAMLFTLFLLVLFTIYVHALVQLRFRPRDMGFLDLMLHLSMESLICLSGGAGPRVCLAVSLLCAAIILYRCLFYCASKGGHDFEKDKEDDPLLVNSARGTTNGANSIQDGKDEKSRGLDLLQI